MAAVTVGDISQEAIGDFWREKDYGPHLAPGVNGFVHWLTHVSFLFCTCAKWAFPSTDTHR